MQFRRVDQRMIRADLTAYERMLLASFAQQLLIVLSDEDDPARDRLLPNAYPDDPEAAAEFRRFTAEDLTARKVENARAVLEAINNTYEADAEADAQVTEADIVHAILLDEQTVQQWLRTLADLRLTIANRLGITSDDDEGRVDPDAQPLQQSYHWLGAIQESLVLTLDN